MWLANAERRVFGRKTLFRSEFQHVQLSVREQLKNKFSVFILIEQFMCKIAPSRRNFSKRFKFDGMFNGPGRQL